MKISLQHNRRSFLKVSAATGGGMLLGFNFFTACKEADVRKAIVIPDNWFDVNGFLKIGDNGVVTIMSPNPEIGQNIKTSMPMIVAEELDVAWSNVIVEQAGLNTDVFTRQVAGGSQSIRKSWDALRMAGATAKKMLVQAAANQWQVDPSKCTVNEGIITSPEGATLSYGEVASAAALLEVPESADLKDPKDFKIIGQPTSNVDIDKIISGAPLFGIDQRKENMKFAVLVRPPSFGQTLDSFDDSAARKVTGVNDVVKMGDKIAVIADNTWAAIKGQKAINASWKDGKIQESSSMHDEKLKALLHSNSDSPLRNDGNVDDAFAAADQVIERIYEAPFLPHNCMEPMNFFAEVNNKGAFLSGPIQTPEWTRSRVAGLLEIEESDVHIDMTRMGGGFGRRLYGDFALEAAELSKQTNLPIQLVFTREDDMTAGTYRPASKYRFKAAIKDGKLTGYHLTGAGINMRNAVRENWFPAGSIENLKIESHNLESNITTGAWRAPVTNFLAYAEQSFFDEIAVATKTDAIQLRIELLQRAAENPVGEIDYEPAKMIGVLNLLKEKSDWANRGDRNIGISAYYSHNTYVAEMAEIVIEKKIPRVTKVICTIDCGILVNPLGATNQVEGGIIDGIGHAMYGQMQFENGKPQQSNFHNYRMIRMGEAPEIEVHFVPSQENPTGLGEPSLPPAAGALANAYHAATGKRLYKQPFINDIEILG